MSFNRQWRRFRRLPHTWGPTPGVREAWHQGRRWYPVWVVRLEDPAVVHRRDEVAARLGSLAEPFSTHTPHVTAWVGGWEAPSEHPPEGTPVRVEVGGANAFASCPFLEVRAPELSLLRRQFSGVEERWGGYLPHLTVGRFNGSHPVGPAVAALRPVRNLPSLRVVGRLTLAWVDAFHEHGDLRYSS